MVILAPGNPLTSIGPMLQIKGIRKELSKIKKKVVAVSPLIGDNAITGPAAKYMQAAGIESNAYGLAKMDSDVCYNIIDRYKRQDVGKENSEFRYESF